MIDRDAIAEFVELHRIQLVAALSAFLVVLAAILVLALASGGERRQGEKNARSAMADGAIRQEELWLPSEPLPLPGVQLFRESAPQWSPGEVKKWYTVPDTASLAELRSAGKRQIEKILETVP